MNTETITIACLPLNKTPSLLFDLEYHDAGECDHCGTKLLVPKCIELFEGEPARSCPACIAGHLDLAHQLLARLMYPRPSQC